MDREQIVRILNDHAKFINDGSGSSIMAVRQGHFPRVADDIAKLSPPPSTEVENGWVKMEDKMPEDYEDYQVWEKGAIIATAAHYLTKKYFLDNYEDENYMEEGWYYSFKYPFDVHCEEPLTVTHWCNLPQPPTIQQTIK